MMTMMMMIMGNCLSVFCDAQDASAAARGRLQVDACIRHRQMPMELEFMEISPPAVASAVLLSYNSFYRLSSRGAVAVAKEYS